MGGSLFGVIAMQIQGVAVVFEVLWVVQLQVLDYAR